MPDTSITVAVNNYNDALPGKPSIYTRSKHTLRPGGKKGSASGARLKYHTKYCAVTTCSQENRDVEMHMVRECVAHQTSARTAP